MNSGEFKFQENYFPFIIFLSRSEPHATEFAPRIYPQESNFPTVQLIFLALAPFLISPNRIFTVRAW